MSSIVNKALPYVLLLIAAWLLVAFWNALAYVDLMILPAGQLVAIPVQELAIWTLMLFFGTSAALCLLVAFEKSGLSAKRNEALSRLFTTQRRERIVATCLAIFSVAASFGIRAFVLREQPANNDELVYETIARTLACGRLTNPAAAVDLPFFSNLFIILNTDSWYGKYPIGHPLVLALGLLVRAPYLPVALMSLATSWCTWKLAHRWYGPRRAMLALFLLSVSPHFVFTFATLVSQTTTTFCLMLGLWLLDTASVSKSRYFWAGLVFGLGALARPAPSGLFAAGASLLLCVAAIRKQARWSGVTLFVIPVAAAATALFIVNRLQTGAALTSGYAVVHGGYGQFGHADGQIGYSVMGAFLRETFWLTGAPIVFSILPLARLPRSKRFVSPRILVAGALGFELLYRIAIPKTVVSSTGPVYVTETVPLLCLLLPDALFRLSRVTRRFFPLSHVAVSLVTAGTLLSMTTLVPLGAMSLHRGAAEREIFFDAVTEARASANQPIVVFAGVINANLEASWAPYAPNRDPAAPFDADPLILTTLDLPAMQALMARRFPNRRAYFWTVETGRGELLPLSEFGRPRPNASGVRGLTGPPPGTN